MPAKSKDNGQSKPLGFVAWAVVNDNTGRIIMKDMAGVSWPSIYTRGARRMCDSNERLQKVKIIPILK